MCRTGFSFSICCHSNETFDAVTSKLSRYWRAQSKSWRVTSAHTSVPLILNVAVSTASHGGIRVSLTALARIPEPLQATAYSGAGWFEEDCDWAIPYLALGLDAFEPDAARAAEVWAAAVHTVKRYHPQHAAALGADGDPERRPHG